MKKRMRYRCMHSQSMNRLNRWSRLSPVMSCRWIGRHFCRWKKALVPTCPAQVRAEQRGRPRWEQRRGQEVELKGSLACLWLFFKEPSLVDQGESSTEQIWNGILHFSLSFFCGECFALRGSSRVEFGLMMLNAGNTIPVSSSFMSLQKTYNLNLLLTLNKSFESWKHLQRLCARTGMH